MRPSPLLAACLLALSGCAHSQLTQDAAARMHHPAFVVRVTPRGEGSPGVPRYELAERLRAGLFQALPRKAPWTGRVDPLAVVAELQLLLVQDESSQPPEYQNLRRVGADSVVDVEVRSWGLRADAKRGDTLFVEAAGKAFLLDGGGLWSGGISVSVPAPAGLSPSEQRALLLEAFATAGQRVAAQLSPEAAEAAGQNR